MPCSEISLASGICYLIFIGSLIVRVDLSDYKFLVIGQVKSDSFGVIIITIIIVIIVIISSNGNRTE